MGARAGRLAAKNGGFRPGQVPKGSVCPTYAAVSLKVDNERWAGVPMMITAGKGLSERTCTVEAASAEGEYAIP
jgi:glucose-6-phosphate 1-dehydrogenase